MQHLTRLVLRVLTVYSWTDSCGVVYVRARLARVKQGCIGQQCRMSVKDLSLGRCASFSRAQVVKPSLAVAGRPYAAAAAR